MTTADPRGGIPAPLRALLLAALAALSPASLAAGIGLLQEFVREYGEGSAVFEQELYDEEGGLLLQTRGRLWFARPDRFRLEYGEPEPMLLVSDGKEFWHYDPGLSQVMVQRFDEIRGNFALSLLTGGAEQSAFILTSPPAKGDGYHWVHATPVDRENSHLEDVWIAFDRAGGGLSHMEYLDSFSNTTVLRFTRLEKGVDEKMFAFQPPPGTAVVSADE